MIQSFSIENFKSFRKATLPLAPLTLLIGANASGKSNAIEAIQLLAWLGSGHPLNDLLYGVREQELSLRGGYRDLWSGDGDIVLGCTLMENSERPLFSASLSLGATESGLRITKERLRLGEELLYESTDTLQGSKTADKPYFVTILQGDKRRPNFEVLKASIELVTELSFTFLLDPDPKRMREYSFVQEQQLKRDGSAISSVLRRLTEEEGKKASILDFIHSLPEQDISDIGYIETPRGEVMVQLHETFGGKAVPRDAALLSDGTLRVLAVAAALLSIPEGSVIVIEEIDNGVHPSRAEKLLADIRRIASERNLRVLLTTHNPALLDALPVEAIPDTVACYRDPVEGDSRLIRLEELASYPELVAQGPLGRLVTKGILDRYLKEPEKRDPAAKAERGLAWLSEFRRAQSS
jgi:predicted ATPase